MQTHTIARATVEINRTHPDAKDASVSTRGHELTIRKTWTDGPITPAIIAEWIRTTAPEIDPNGPKFHANEPDSFTEFYFLPTARDSRGYFTDVYIRLYFADYQPTLDALTTPPARTVETYESTRDNHRARWDIPEYRKGWNDAAHLVAAGIVGDKATADVYAREALARANAAQDAAARFFEIGKAARYFTL